MGYNPSVKDVFKSAWYDGQMMIVDLNCNRLTDAQQGQDDADGVTYEIRMLNPKLRDDGHMRVIYGRNRRRGESEIEVVVEWRFPSQCLFHLAYEQLCVELRNIDEGRVWQF